MVDMPPRARFPSYYPRFPLFAGSVRLVVNRGPGQATLDKQMQNEKELIRLAIAGVGGLFLYLFGEYELDLT